MCPDFLKKSIKRLILHGYYKKTNFCLIFGLIMYKVKLIIIQLFVIFISFIIIDGGKSIILIGDNIQILMNHEHNSDLEIPHHYNFNKSFDNEKWMNSNSTELSCLYSKLFLFFYLPDRRIIDFTWSVWQPPKSV
jgi:hypothetical protein